MQINPHLLEVRHDLGDNILFTENDLSRRINITSSRDSLNGYQKGKCFYCRKGIQIEKSSDGDIVDVDHFFPHTLLTELPEVNINGVSIYIFYSWRNYMINFSSCGIIIKTYYF